MIDRFESNAIEVIFVRGRARRVYTGSQIDADLCARRELVAAIDRYLAIAICKRYQRWLRRIADWLWSVP